MPNLFWLITIYAVINGVLYSLLLPLWEGFDEPFHYAYVQELSVRSTFPRLGQSVLSTEIWDSLQLAPASHIVQHNMPTLRTYGEFFALPQSQRLQLRDQLERIQPATRYEPSIGHGNYEAHQAPLAYALLAIPDKLLSNCSLLLRVRALRIFAVILAIGLTAGAAAAMCFHLGIPTPYREAVLLMTFSSQMFFAATAHICNDWLAVPVASWLIVAAIRLQAKPALRTVLEFASIMGLGLLSKSYFLAFMPMFGAELVFLSWRGRLKARVAAVGFCVAGLIAGPWYARNLRLYGSLTAMPEAISGIGVAEVIRSVPAVPWSRSISYMARASLWTGNNQFNTFSRLTLNALLLLLFAGLCCYLFKLRERKMSATDLLAVGAISSFIAAIAYSTVVSFIYTHGASAGASPWYMQVILLPVVALAMAGLARSHYAARMIACANVLLWTYTIVATYILKLLPQYGGYDPGATRIGAIYDWYLHSGEARDAILSTTTLAEPILLYTLTGIVTVLAAITCQQTSKRILNGGE